MIEKHIKASKITQSGSVSILIVLVVIITCLLSAGMIAVAEANSHTRFVQHAVQSTANAAAFAYAQDYVKNVKACIKDKIVDQSLSPEAENFPASSCEASKIIACAESDFKECEIDFSSCFEGIDSPIVQCQSDAEVIATSESTAMQRGKAIATQYELEKIKIFRQNQKYIVEGSNSLHSEIPQFGQQKVDSYRAESKILISKR